MLWWKRKIADNKIIIIMTLNQVLDSLKFAGIAFFKMLFFYLCVVFDLYQTMIFYIPMHASDKYKLTHADP